MVTMFSSAPKPRVSGPFNEIANCYNCDKMLDVFNGHMEKNSIFRIIIGVSDVFLRLSWFKHHSCIAQVTYSDNCCTIWSIQNTSIVASIKIVHWFRKTALTPHSRTRSKHKRKSRHVRNYCDFSYYHKK